MNDATDRIARNSMFVLAGMGAEFVSGIIILFLATRYLGPHDFGKYAFIRVTALVLFSIVAFGSLRILIREISVEKRTTAVFVAAGLILNSLMAIPVLVIAALVAFAFGLTSTTAVLALYIAVLSQVLLAMTRTVGSVFIAHEKMAYNAAISIFTRLLAILFVLMVIYSDLGFVIFFVALAVPNAVGLFLALSIVTRRFARPEWAGAVRQVRFLFKESFPIAISTFLTQGYKYVNVYVLKAFRDFVQVSFFQGPQQIIQPLLLLPRSFLLAFVPTLSRLGSNSDSYPSLRYACRQTLKYILILTLPVCICGTIYASKIVLLLFGKEFSEAAASLQILIWTIVPLFGNILFEFVLTSIRRQNVLMISSGLCLAINCVLGLVLVQKYGYLGASWACLFSYIGLFVANFCFISKYLGFIPTHRIILRP